jgi:hypothetical protein
MLRAIVAFPALFLVVKVYILGVMGFHGCPFIKPVCASKFNPFGNGGLTVNLVDGIQVHKVTAASQSRSNIVWI